LSRGSVAHLKPPRYVANGLRHARIAFAQNPQLKFSLPSTKPHIIATMASKFMANAAFEARLLLRPSHQRTVWTVNKLKCPIPGRPTVPPILCSRSYSDYTSTPPLLKTSGSTESSQTSGLEDKTYSNSTSTPPFPKSSGSTEGSQSSGPKDKNWFNTDDWTAVAAVATAALVRAGSFLRAN
jgi:hypothetical protein